MSEDEKDVLVSKRKYWTKFMKYNLANTVLVPPLSGIIHEFLNWRIDANFEWMATIIMFWAFFIIISWPLSFIMYVYHSLKIHEITKPKVLAKSSEMSLRSTQKHNGAMGEDEITRLKSIAELRDSGVLTDDEFQEQKSKILSETPSQNNENLSFKDYTNLSNLSLGKSVVVGIVVGVIILISIISLFSFLGGSGHDRAYVEYNTGWCWSGAFHNGGSIISISGCGDESFNCMDNGDFCTINAQKEDDNAYELCVRVGDKRACTTAGYGVAQV